MKIPFVIKLVPILTKRGKKHRQLSQIQIENFDLNDFSFYSENRL